MDERLKTHFDVLFGSLKDYQTGLFDGAFKFTGFLILVIGWLLTSKETRVLMAHNAAIRRLCAAAIGIGSIVYAVVSWRVFEASQVAFGRLVALDYIPVAAYADHRIEASALVLLIVQNALLSLVACYFMLDPAARKEP